VLKVINKLDDKTHSIFVPGILTELALTIEEVIIKNN